MSQRENRKAAAARRQYRRRVILRYTLLVITLIFVGIYGGFLIHIQGAAQRQPLTVEESVAELAPVPKSTDQPKYDFYVELPESPEQPAETRQEIDAEEPLNE